MPFLGKPLLQVHNTKVEACITNTFRFYTFSNLNYSWKQVTVRKSTGKMQSVDTYFDQKNCANHKHDHLVPTNPELIQVADFSFPVSQTCRPQNCCPQWAVSRMKLSGELRTTDGDGTRNRSLLVRLFDSEDGPVYPNTVTSFSPAKSGLWLQLLAFVNVTLRTIECVPVAWTALKQMRETSPQLCNLLCVSSQYPPP